MEICYSSAMDYIELTKQDVELQRKLLKVYRKALSKIPAGRLSAKRIKGKVYYYRVDEVTRKETYIPKKDLELIHQLKQKRWLMKVIAIIEKNLRVQEKLLKAYHPYQWNAIEKLIPDSDGDNLLREYEEQILPDLHRWAKGPYRKNPYYKEHLLYKTSFGLKVRSKSEMLIAELLYSYRIPFQYDAEIRIKDNYGRYKSRYVDFLFKLPDGSYLIWEHMGLFAKEDYRKDQFEKLTEYFFEGFFMPNNLIITMDGPNMEFDNLAVERIIKGQILPYFA